MTHTRRTLLKRGLLAGAALGLAGRVPLGVEEIATVEPAFVPFAEGTFIKGGGICAPLSPIYDIPGFPTSTQPIREALPSFQVVRGTSFE
jgi:hypothetical protein